jgi:transcriptional regulator with XRE-family HTH domain
MISGQELRALLGKRIQFYRKQRQLSQATLAEKADISITFISQIERGIKYPTSETLSGIVNVLGVEVRELFQEDETPAEHRKILERFKNDILGTVEDVYKAYEDSY